MKKGVSIVITPIDSGNSRYLFFSQHQFVLYLSIFVIITTMVVIAVINFGLLSYKRIEADALRRRNAEIEKEFKKLIEIKRALEIAEINNQKIKIMLGIEKAQAPVEPVIERVSAKYFLSAEPLATAEENIPSLLPTMGQISKKFTVGHPGIDIAAPRFSIVIATASGKVTDVGWDSLYGNYVVIEHGKNYCTFYGHLNTIACKRGEPVAAGQVIGTVGSSGRSTSVHLHYEVRFQGEPVDPMAYLPYLIE